MTTPILCSAAQAYADAGFCLFPLIGKIPARKGNWTQTVFDPFPEFEGNFGVVLRECDIVIDIDPRNFNGQDSEAELWRRLGQDLSQTTFTVRTGGGGKHVYLKKEDGQAIRGAIKELPGIEFKTKGQYLVGAGGLHPDSGRVYEILGGSPVSRQPAPERLIKLVQKATAQRGPAEGAGIKEYTKDAQTVGRFTAYLKTAPVAISGQSGDATTFSVACIGHDFGLAPGTTLECMSKAYNPRCEPPWGEEELQKKVYNAYRYATGALGVLEGQVQFESVTDDILIPEGQLRWDWTASGTKKISQHNVENYFLWKGCELNNLIAFNEFSHDICFMKPAPWHASGSRRLTWVDTDTIQCISYLASKFHFEPNVNILLNAVIAVAQLRSFHPVRAYLDGLVWDGHSRINTWLRDFVGAEDNPYTRAVGVKWLISAIARIMEPGCQADYMLVLEGEQGTFKSDTFRILAGEYFSDKPLDIHNKDTIMDLFGKWIVECAEMETHYRQDTQAMKGFLTSRKDRCRLPYGRISQDFPRQCVFGGSINPEPDADLGWLKDTTGNRRYWPVKTNVIDRDGLRTVRDLLWAEALHLYKKGVSWYLDDQKIANMAVEEQKKRMGADPWQEKIDHWLRTDHDFRNRQVVRVDDIFTACLGGRSAQFGRQESKRIVNALLQMNWIRGTFYCTIYGRAIYGFKRPLTTVNGALMESL